MGLDMYLSKKVYVGNDFKDRADQATINVSGVKQQKVSYVIEEQGYWRKANAIHKWFVDNIQGGKDECQMTHAPQEKLQELLDTCNKVLKSSKLVAGKINNGYHYTKDGGKQAIIQNGQKIADPATAHKLLPTASGFFGEAAPSPSRRKWSRFFPIKSSSVSRRMILQISLTRFRFVKRPDPKRFPSV